MRPRRPQPTESSAVAGERDFKQARGEIIRGRTALMAATRNTIVGYLKTAFARISAILAAQPTDYQQWALARLAAEIRQVLARFGEEAGDEISSAAGKAWDLGQDLVDRPLAAGGVRLEASLARIDVRQLQAMRAFMTDRIKNVGLAAADKINAELGLVVIGAQSPSDAIGKVRVILGETSRARATTIVRTELARAFSSASYERLMEAAARVPGLQKQWRKSGKAHPRPHHDLIDGQVREVNEPFVTQPFGRLPVKLMYPHDPRAPASETINCGCTMLPYKADWTVQYPARAPGGLEAAPSVRELLAGGAKPGPRAA